MLSRDTMGNTPLHLASYYGRIDTVGALIEEGADVTTTNNIGATPFKRSEDGER